MPAMCLSLNLPCGVADRTLTPPTVAPVLTVGAFFASFTAMLQWTASNKTGSDGFGYRVDLSINGGAFNEVTSLSSEDLSYNDQQNSAIGETYTYRVTPFNSAGDGVASNTASVILPGINP